MNKTEQLLKMLEHPEQYTERQWQDILAGFLHDIADNIAARFRSFFVIREEGTEAFVGIAEDNRHIEYIHLLFWINENPIFREHVCL